jgi:RimJ/RimL family protein N-acetyltransferase
MIAAMLARAELRDVELFEAGVEPQNTASRRCLDAADFELRSPEPDFEGMLYYRYWRRDLIERATGSG